MEGDTGMRYITVLSSELKLIILLRQDEKDTAKLSAFYNERVKELAVLKRSAIVNSLYGGWKLAVEEPKKPGLTLERSDS